MANKKFSQFTAQAPNAATSYLVGYDATANDNIRFQEGDLNLADMGGAVDLATQATGVLPQANGGSGVTQLKSAQEIGRKLVAQLWWTTNLLNVPRGAEYTLPLNQNEPLILNHTSPTVGYVFNFTGLPAGLTQLGAINAGYTIGAISNLKQLFKITLRLSFYDQTSDLDIQGGFYSSTNALTWATNLKKYLLIKDTANEASDSRIYEASAYFEVPAAFNTPYYFVPWVRFDNGFGDPYPYYDVSMEGAACQFTIEQIY